MIRSFSSYFEIHTVHDRKACNYYAHPTRKSIKCRKYQTMYGTTSSDSSIIRPRKPSMSTTWTPTRKEICQISQMATSYFWTEKIIFWGETLCLRWLVTRLAAKALIVSFFHVEDLRNYFLKDIYGSRLKFYSKDSKDRPTGHQSNYVAHLKFKKRDACF